MAWFGRGLAGIILSLLALGVAAVGFWEYQTATPGTYHAARISSASFLYGLMISGFCLYFNVEGDESYSSSLSFFLSLAAVLINGMMFTKTFYESMKLGILMFRALQTKSL